MTVRLKQALSWWFILQILLPFTAPLQTLDLPDLLGTRSHHSTQASPESSTTPTMSEAETTASVSMRATPTLVTSASAMVIDAIATARPLASAFDLVPSPHVQRSILRL